MNIFYFNWLGKEIIVELIEINEKEFTISSSFGMKWTLPISELKTLLK